MRWPGRKPVYDRSRILSQAGRARGRGRARKAIALYRRVLDHEPQNAEVHRRIAPLLASTRQGAEAWASYQTAVDGLTSRGFLDQAAGVLREACAKLRGAGETQCAVWERLADVELERGRPADARAVLLEGSRRLRSRRERPEAVRLLLRARKLDRTDFPVNYELAGLLARCGARSHALRILEELARTTRGRRLRRLRGRQLRLAPSPGALARWLRAALSGR